MAPPVSGPLPDTLVRFVRCGRSFPGRGHLSVVRPVGTALLHEDEHHAVRVGEPGGTQADKAGHTRREELDTVLLETSPGRVDVVTQQPDVGQTMADHRGVVAARPSRVLRILDHFEHPISIVGEADDRRLHRDRRRHQLAHVALDRRPPHLVRRREHLQAQHVPVPRNGRVDVGHAHGTVRQARDHATRSMTTWRMCHTISPRASESARPSSPLARASKVSSSARAFAAGRVRQTPRFGRNMRAASPVVGRTSTTSLNTRSLPAGGAMASSAGPTKSSWPSSCMTAAMVDRYDASAGGRTSMLSTSSSNTRPPSRSSPVQPATHASGAARCASRNRAYTRSGAGVGNGSAVTSWRTTSTSLAASATNDTDSSTPITRAPGQARASIRVVWPGPQPRSRATATAPGPHVRTNVALAGPNTPCSSARRPAPTRSSPTRYAGERPDTVGTVRAAAT